MENYLCKLLNDKTLIPTGSEMVDLIPINFDWKQQFLLDIPNSAANYSEFYAMLKEFIEKNGPEKALANFHDCSFFSSNRHGHLSELLLGDLANKVTPRDCFYLEGYYFGNNLMAELMPSHFKKAPLRQLSIDVVTVNPDVGFSDSDVDKDLCIRILADLEGIENSKLYKWFENLQMGSFYETNFGGKGECVYAILAGAKRTETIDMEVESQEFWDRYKNRWWAKMLKDELTQDSTYKPYQVINFLIHIHASWLNEKLSYNPFYSIAYSVPY